MSTPVDRAIVEASRLAGSEAPEDEERAVAGFIQIIEYRTSRPEEVRAVSQRFRDRRAAEGSAGSAVRGTVTADRDRPGVYLSIVEFPSYEEAMANSDRPDTREFAAAMAELCDGPPRFVNLDVQEVFTPVPSQDSVRA